MLVTACSWAVQVCFSFCRLLGAMESLHGGYLEVSDSLPVIFALLSLGVLGIPGMMYFSGRDLDACITP